MQVLSAYCENCRYWDRDQMRTIPYEGTVVDVAPCKKRIPEKTWHAQSALVLMGEDDECPDKVYFRQSLKALREQPWALKRLIEAYNPMEA